MQAHDMSLSVHSSSSENDLDTPNKTYFDLLPFDVILKICKLTCREEVSEEVLAIAGINEDSAKAIDQCLNGTIDLRHLPNRPIKFYVDAIQLCRSVKQLYLPKREVHSPIFRTVLARSSLKKVEMPCISSYLQALRESGFVESLSLFVVGRHVPQREVLKTLQRLPLTHLQMVCYHWPSAHEIYECEEVEEHNMEVRRSEDICPSSEDIASHCRGIKRLHLICKCRGGGQFDIISVLGIIGSLRNLTISSARSELNPEEVHALRSLEQIKITSQVPCNDILACIIQTNVTSYSASTYLYRHDIQRVLNNCPSLKELDLKLYRRGLECVARYPAGLTSLGLTWKPISVGYPRLDFPSCNEAKLREIAVKHSSLSRLEIYCAKINFGTIQAILEALGPSLKVFGCNIEKQYESDRKILLSLMSASAQHCENLRELWITDCHHFPREIPPKRELTNLNERSRCCLETTSDSQKSEIWKGVLAMNRRLEHFKTHVLRMQIAYMMYGSIDTHASYDFSTN